MVPATPSRTMPGLAVMNRDADTHVLAQLSTQFDSGGTVGEVNIDQRQIHIIFAHEILRGLCGRGDAHDLVTQVFQDEPKLHGHQGLVFDDQDTRGHDSSL